MMYETQQERDEDRERCDDIGDGYRTQSVAEILDAPLSPYTGSELTRKMVEEQIAERWGKSEVENYDPYSNALTFSAWIKRGFRVIKGEKALRSVTYREVKDASGQVKKYPKTVFLFYQLQVKKM